ncbi:unnamed protein product [Fraxinus pennsylvanica]|uniref:Uncharacterized protein n=1 Tax=Fraxinus pennsylvanica TaxID=56036 RepID=A0AAD1YWE3_9LAMI|nr:unnamed protein product [Fraxinus pennsylvanica]
MPFLSRVWGILSVLRAIQHPVNLLELTLCLYSKRSTRTLPLASSLHQGFIGSYRNNLCNEALGGQILLLYQTFGTCDACGVFVTGISPGSSHNASVSVISLSVNSTGGSGVVASSIIGSQFYMQNPVSLSELSPIGGSTIGFIVTPTRVLLSVIETTYATILFSSGLGSANLALIPARLKVYSQGESRPGQGHGPKVNFWHMR